MVSAGQEDNCGARVGSRAALCPGGGGQVWKDDSRSNSSHGAPLPPGAARCPAPAGCSRHCRGPREQHRELADVLAGEGKKSHKYISERPAMMNLCCNTKPRVGGRRARWAWAALLGRQSGRASLMGDHLGRGLSEDGDEPWCVGDERPRQRERCVPRPGGRSVPAVPGLLGGSKTPAAAVEGAGRVGQRWRVF